MTNAQMALNIRQGNIFIYFCYGKRVCIIFGMPIVYEQFSKVFCAPLVTILKKSHSINRYVAKDQI